MSHRKSRAHFSCWMAAAAIVLFCACGVPAYAKDRIVLKLDWLPTGEHQAPFAGDALGYFAEENIDIEIIRGVGSADAFNAVTTGAAQYGYGDLANLWGTYKQGAGVKALMAIYARAPFAIITRADTGIKSFADLVGRTIGAPGTASINLYFPVLLNHLKIDSSKIRIINVEPAALSAMLLTKRVDAALLFSTNTAQLSGPAREAGIELVVLPFADAGMVMYNSVIIATQKQLETQPDLTRRFLRALRRSFLYARDHPDETAAFVQKKYPQQIVAVEAARLRVVNKFMFSHTDADRKFGCFDQKLLRETFKWAMQATHIDPTIDPEAVIDLSFLPSDDGGHGC